MALPNIMQTGRSGLTAAKTNIATTGHNIANSTTEGYSRQRVQQEAVPPASGYDRRSVGDGTRVNRTERINDSYLEKQLRTAGRDFAHAEEKDMALKQAESIFNEMGGDGLNRLISRFFNEFRTLANEPDSEAVRQSVREATQAMTNDFRRLRREVVEVGNHLDSKVEGYVKEINTLADQISELNLKIFEAEVRGASPNDLLDKRDVALKNLGAYCDISVSTDNQGRVTVDLKGVGPLISGTTAQKLRTDRTPQDPDTGKVENALDIRSEFSATPLTDRIKGGKIGALLEVRDHSLTTILDRLDELAYGIANAVNDVHMKGVTRDGATGIEFFRRPAQKERAAEYLTLSDAVSASSNNIATAAIPDAPSDNRIALTIASLQGQKVLNGGKSTVDDFYNSIVADVGVAAARNRTTLNQAKDIQNQLGKFREQLSGVSIDEETTKLMEFQNAFAANAKVIQVADEMLKTVLEIKR